MTTVNKITGEVIESLMSNYTDDDLLRVLDSAQDHLDTTAREIGRLKQEIHKRLTDRGAKKLYGEGLEYEDSTQNEYDRSKLPRLLEILKPEEKDKCYIPAHEAMIEIPAKWDMTQVKKFAKAHGGEAQKIVDNATFKGTPKGKLIQA